MTHLFAQRYTSSCSPNSASVGGVSGPPQPQPLRFQQHNIANAPVASSPRWRASHYNKMDTPSFHPAAEHSSPVAGSSSLDRSSQEPTLKASASASVGSEGGQYLPPQVFSSPTDHTYPASTLAAVEATRARFFARHARGGRSFGRGVRPRLCGVCLVHHRGTTQSRSIRRRRAQGAALYFPP